MRVTQLATTKLEICLLCVEYSYAKLKKSISSVASKRGNETPVKHVLIGCQTFPAKHLKFDMQLRWLNWIFLGGIPPKFEH